MRIVDVATWLAAGLAVVAVVLAAWQVGRAHRRLREADHYANRVHELASQVESHAVQAQREARNASSQARWAWEQVKLANKQLEQAQTEHRSSDEAEQWELCYALTVSARETVDAGNELVRATLDAQVAPHYRLAADRHYRQTAARWQETMTKALARTDPTLEVQHQVLTFTQVQHRLHGLIGVLLRAAETGTVSESDAVAKEALGAGQELENVRRNLQRTLSATLARPHMAGAGTTLNGQATSRVSELTQRREEPARQGGGRSVRGALEQSRSAAPPPNQPTPPPNQPAAPAPNQPTPPPPRGRTQQPSGHRGR